MSKKQQKSYWLFAVHALRLAAASTIVGMLTVGAGPAGAITKSQVQTKALSFSDMPIGWSVNNSKGSSTSNCSGSNKAAKHDARAEVSYDNGNVPVMAEAIEGGPSAGAAYQAALKRLNKCTMLKLTNGGTTISGGGGAMSFPATPGAKTSAYAFSLADKGVSIGFDFVLFDVGKYAGLIYLGDIGTPDTNLLEYFVSAAIDKAEGKPLPPVPSS